MKRKKTIKNVFLAPDSYHYNPETFPGIRNHYNNVPLLPIYQSIIDIKTKISYKLAVCH